MFFRQLVVPSLMMIALLAPAATGVINEVCTNAMVVSVNDRIGNTRGVLPDDGTSCGGFGPSEALWYMVKGTGAIIVADTCSSGTNFDTVISILKGSCSGDKSTCIAFNDDGCGRQSLVRWQTELNVDYYIRVGGGSMSAGTGGDLVLTIGPPPENEVCTNATEVSLNDPERTGNTMVSLSEDGTKCDGIRVSSKALWYMVKGTGASMVADTCSSGTNFDTVISIVRGTCGGDTSTCIGSNDKGCSEKRVIRWQTEQNVDYYVRVGGSFGGRGGAFVLRLSGYPPENEVCKNATVVRLNDPERTGNTRDISSDGGTSCGGFGRSPALWYIVKGTGGSMVAHTCSSDTNFDTVISIVRDTCGGDTSTCIAFNDDGCGHKSLVRWQTEPNVDYYIRVAGYEESDFGDFGLLLLVPSVPVSSSPPALPPTALSAGRAFLYSICCIVVCSICYVIVSSKCHARSSTNCRAGGYSLSCSGPVSTNLCAILLPQDKHE